MLACVLFHLENVTGCHTGSIVFVSGADLSGSGEIIYHFSLRLCHILYIKTDNMTAW